MGLLVYNFQTAKSDRNYYYDKFRDAATSFRKSLNFLYDEGIIGIENDNWYRDIERLTMDALPVGWEETFLPFLEALADELRDSIDSEEDYNRIIGDIGVKAVMLNDAVNGLWVNLMRRVVMQVLVSPVIKSFRVLALTIFSVLIGAIYFAGVSAHILTGLAIGIGCMTMLLIVEMGFIAVAESREFFDDKTDVDHSRTGTDAQMIQDEAAPTEA